VTGITVHQSDIANWKVGKKFSAILSHVYNPIGTILNDREPQMTVLSPVSLRRASTRAGGGSRLARATERRPNIAAFSATVLLRCLRAFREDFPEVEIFLVEMDRVLVQIVERLGILR
jgi:hypothetical protein